MTDGHKSLAPEPYFTAYLFVLRSAILKLRMWIRYGDKVSDDQIYDLMDAIHNIPELLYHYGDWQFPENVVLDLERYDAKWGALPESTPLKLSELLKKALAENLPGGGWLRTGIPDNPQRNCGPDSSDRGQTLSTSDSGSGLG